MFILDLSYIYKYRRVDKLPTNVLGSSGACYVSYLLCQAQVILLVRVRVCVLKIQLRNPRYGENNPARKSMHNSMAFVCGMFVRNEPRALFHIAWRIGLYTNICKYLAQLNCHPAATRIKERKGENFLICVPAFNILVKWNYLKSNIDSIKVGMFCFWILRISHRFDLWIFGFSPDAWVDESKCVFNIVRIHFQDDLSLMRLWTERNVKTQISLENFTKISIAMMDNM